MSSTKPEKPNTARNAMSRGLMRELIDVAHGLSQYTDTQVVILTGSDICFSASVDLKETGALMRGFLLQTSLKKCW